MSTKVRQIYFDTETYRTRNEAAIKRVCDAAIAKQPAQNTAKELKLEWNTEEGRDARAKAALDKTAVNVLLAEVLVVCYSHSEEGFCANGMRQTEREALEGLAKDWAALSCCDTIWIGHNIQNFDLPLLLNRFRRHGITPPPDFPKFSNGRWIGRVFDTMTRTPCENGLGLVSLDSAMEAYGIPVGEGVQWQGEAMNGARVGAAFEAGEYDVIQEYCMEDVIGVIALYERMTFCGTWGTYDTRDSVAEQIRVIEQSDLSEAVKALAKYEVIDKAGLVPRVA